MSGFTKASIYHNLCAVYGNFCAAIGRSSVSWGLTFAALFVGLSGAMGQSSVTSWTADNGNGTYTNPLFYDEFSDPDLIRVGGDFYLAGTTMHSTPGLVVLHSKDLVNWEFESYCFQKFDMSDEFRLENGKEAYGQGIWAPCIRYHKGKFYVFSNINGVGLQVYIADSAKGPWKHINMGGKIYDLSVLFDEEADKIYAVYKYNEVHLIEMKPDFSGYVEGSERVIIPAGNAMGEGHHIYKIQGKYYIISANYSPVGRMQCARADRIEGPYETAVISASSCLGTLRSHTVKNVGFGPLPEDGFKAEITGGEGNYLAATPLHQGGIVDLPNGDWWGFSMMDFRSVGRTVCLSPVTWHEGWPYFGTRQNLGHTPRTWTKPRVAESVKPHAPYDRSDDFQGRALKPVWQFNHDAQDGFWALKGGALSIRAQAAENFLLARNTLTERAIGPVSENSVDLDFSHLKSGDIAGLGILNVPYAFLAVEKSGKGCFLKLRIQGDGSVEETIAAVKRSVRLRVDLDLDKDSAQFSFSLNGKDFQKAGRRFLVPYQLKTFQGARLALFAFNRKAKTGGEALFDRFSVVEPLADRSQNIPLGKVISLKNLGNNSYAWANPHGMLHQAGRNSKEYQNSGCFFKVHDRGNGTVALEAMNGTGFLTVVGAGLAGDVRLEKTESEGSLFLWQDMLRNAAAPCFKGEQGRGDCMLLSLKTGRYVGLNTQTGEPYSVDKQTCWPDRKDGTVFLFEVQQSDGVVRQTEKPYVY